jgi:hypothetical protein
MARRPPAQPAQHQAVKEPVVTGRDTTSALSTWMYERTIRLNELAQGLRPLVPGGEQFEVLRDLRGLCIQARAMVEDGPESVRRSASGRRILRGPGHARAAARAPTKIINLSQGERGHCGF